MLVHSLIDLHPLLLVSILLHLVRVMLKILFICFLLKTVRAIDSTVWSHQLWLDPSEKYSLKWNVDLEKESITFLCEVQTRGWIGFGLSPNGGMKDSDIIIGWIDDNSGRTHFNVYLNSIL